MHIGGACTFDFGRVKLTQAIHGSAIIGDTIEYTGLAAGFIIEMGGVKVYFAGDTGLFGDMRLIGEEGLDVAILPIGDCFTMGPEDALKAVGMLQPKIVIPTHYSAFEVILQDAPAFAARLEALGVEGMVLRPGEQTSI